MRRVRAAVGGMEANDVVGEGVKLLVVRDRDDLRCAAKLVDHARHTLPGD